MTQAIVEFPKSRKAHKPALAPDNSAEIIIFPGVRFERLGDMAAIEEISYGDKTTRQMRTLFAELLQS
jgi:hypothetical protein